MILLRPNQNPVDALITVLRHQVDRIRQSQKKEGVQSVFFLLDICDPFAAKLFDRVDGEGAAERELKDDRMEGIPNVDSFVHLCPQLLVTELHEARVLRPGDRSPSVERHCPTRFHYLRHHAFRNVRPEPWSAGRSSARD